MKTLNIMMVYALIFMLSVAYAKTATDMAENSTTNHSVDQSKVIHFVKKTENYIKKNGVK